MIASHYRSVHPKHKSEKKRKALALDRAILQAGLTTDHAGQPGGIDTGSNTASKGQSKPDATHEEVESSVRDTLISQIEEPAARKRMLEHAKQVEAEKKTQAPQAGVQAQNDKASAQTGQQPGATPPQPAYQPKNILEDLAQRLAPEVFPLLHEIVEVYGTEARAKLQQATPPSYVEVIGQRSMALYADQLSSAAGKAAGKEFGGLGPEMNPSQMMALEAMQSFLKENTDQVQKTANPSEIPKKPEDAPTKAKQEPAEPKWRGWDAEDDHIKVPKISPKWNGVGSI